MALDELRVNGNLIGWGSHLMKVDGERVIGVLSVAWDQARERVYGYGMNRAHAPIGATSGKYTPGVLKMGMYKHTATALRARFASLADDGVSYGNPRVPIFLQYVEGDHTTTVEFEDCAITKDGGSDEENPDPTKEEWELQVMRIKVDGLTLYDSTEGD
jgi:hypothetical protein